MRLTGSFQTRVIHGRATSASCADRGSSSSTGDVTTGSTLGAVPRPQHPDEWDAEPARRVRSRLGGVTTSACAPAEPRSTALLTDHYELTMLQAALRSGTAGRRCVFEVFARRLPEGRRYGVVAGTGRLLDALEAFCFGPEEIERLRSARV